MFLLTVKFAKRSVIMIGTFLMALGMSLVGSSSLLGFENDSDLVLCGLCFVGLAAAMMAIPIMPEMLESIEERTEFDYDSDELTNELSSMFVVCIGLGEAIAPVACSLLLTNFGFSET